MAIQILKRDPKRVGYLTIKQWQNVKEKKETDVRI